METRNCQNCKQDFTIEPEDFLFYEKIKVPPPTFCSTCRKQRRLSFRNTHALYKRKDSVLGGDVISIYSSDKDIVVVDQKYWWGDEWDPMDFGRDFDFTKDFFTQWKSLRNIVPFQALSNSKAVNSEYCNVAEESYDCYLISASWRNERVMYSDAISEIKDCSDLHVVHRTEFSYDDVVCTDSYKLFYSQDSHSCTDSYFLYDCHGCVNCFMCSNLRNKSYCYYNEQLTKDEYLNKIKECGLDSFKNIEKHKVEFENLKLKSIHKFAHIVNSYSVTGNNIDHGKNSYECFDSSGGIEDSKDIFWSALGVKNSYSSGPGIGMAELVYESFDIGVGGGRGLFCSVVYYSTNVEYSFNCYNCQDIFGCIGLRNKKYCILNKQYTKEEFDDLVPKIKEHMKNMPYIDKVGRIYAYGEFFPVELSPFCYNETVAQDYYPLTKEEILDKGYTWKDKEEKNYQHTLRSSDLADSINEIDSSILNEIIECAHKGECSDRCSTAFKIVPNELTFYKRFGIPLPRLCYGCRHYGRLKMKNPMKLWHRTCMCDKAGHAHEGNCQNEFETSYAPERPEIIYCEKCYQQEVI